jgi:hypothetical protein
MTATASEPFQHRDMPAKVLAVAAIRLDAGGMAELRGIR